MTALGETTAARTAPQPRGAAPVARLGDLAAVESAAILYLRSWCAGGTVRSRIVEDFRLLLGEAQGREAAEGFEAFVHHLLATARRPLMRHDLDCRCVGADENVVANLIAAATAHDHDEAMLFAGLLLSGPGAFEAVRLAEPLAPVFLRIARVSARAAPKAESTPPVTHRAAPGVTH